MIFAPFLTALSYTFIYSLFTFHRLSCLMHNGRQHSFVVVACYQWHIFNGMGSTKQHQQGYCCYVMMKRKKMWEIKWNSSGSMHLNLHEKFMRECKIEVLFAQWNKIHAFQVRMLSEKINISLEMDIFIFIAIFYELFSSELSSLDFESSKIKLL